jgi:hypothetical protein
MITRLLAATLLLVSLGACNALEDLDSVEVSEQNAEIDFTNPTQACQAQCQKLKYCGDGTEPSDCVQFCKEAYELPEYRAEVRCVVETKDCNAIPDNCYGGMIIEGEEECWAQCERLQGCGEETDIEECVNSCAPYYSDDPTTRAEVECIVNAPFDEDCQAVYACYCVVACSQAVCRPEVAVNACVTACEALDGEPIECLHRPSDDECPGTRDCLAFDGNP